MLEIYYLNLQARILFLRSFRQEWCISVFVCIKMMVLMFFECLEGCREFNIILDVQTPSPFLCSELGPFQAILGNLLGPFSCIFRQFQAISGNFKQFLVIWGSFGGPKPMKKKQFEFTKKKAGDCTPKSLKQIYVSWFLAFWASGTFRHSQRTKSGIFRHFQAKSGTFRHFQGHDFAWSAMISHDSACSIWGSRTKKRKHRRQDNPEKEPCFRRFLQNSLWPNKVWHNPGGLLPQFQENALREKPFSELSQSSGHSRSNSRNSNLHSRNTNSTNSKAILGALGEFRGILGATLGIRNSILGIRNFTSWAIRKPQFSEQLLPKDPDTLKTVRVVNSLSVVNLLCVAIHYWQCSESLHFAVMCYILSSESVCVVNSLQTSKTLRNRTPY